LRHTRVTYWRQNVIMMDRNGFNAELGMKRNKEGVQAGKQKVSLKVATGIFLGRNQSTGGAQNKDRGGDEHIGGPGGGIACLLGRERPHVFTEKWSQKKRGVVESKQGGERSKKKTTGL